MSGPTERSMPPVRMTMSCPKLAKAVAAARVSVVAMLKALSTLAFCDHV